MMKNDSRKSFKESSVSNNFNFSSFKIILSFLGLIMLGIIIVGVSYYGVGIDKKNESKIEPGQYNVGDGKAFFSIDTQNKTYKKGEQNNLIVKLDTNGNSVNTVDFVLKFDSAKVEIDKNNTQVEIFDNFKRSLNVSSGFFEINAGASSNNIFKTFSTNGLQNFVIIPFKLISTVNNYVEILCTDGATNDSNIAVMGNDVINCGVNRRIEFNNIQDINIPTTSTPTPTPTPTSTPGNGGNGGSSQNLSNAGSQPIVEPWCKKTPPSRPANLKAETTGKSGQVHLTWDRVGEEVTHYTVTYGTRWLDFDYGQPNIGNTDQLQVNGLANGKSYYFVVTAVNDCASSGYSDGAAAYAGWIPGTGTSYTTTNTYSQTEAEKGYEYDTTAYDASDDVIEDEDSSESSDFDEEIEEESDDAYFTPEPTVEPYVPEEEEEKSSSFSKALPIIGLVILALLGLFFVILTKFAKKDEQNL